GWIRSKSIGLHSRKERGSPAPGSTGSAPPSKSMSASSNGPSTGSSATPESSPSPEPSEIARDIPSGEGAVSRHGNHEAQDGGVLRHGRAGDATSSAPQTGDDGALSSRHW